MRKLFFILLLIVGFINLKAEIGVKSFRKLETDLDARVNFPLKDQNGDLCAIIKVVTTQTGFSFDAGQLGIMDTKQKASEIWVYVPYGLKRLSIFHPQLGQLRDYIITIPIEKATVYLLELSTGRVVTTVEDEITSQWLLVKTNNSNSMIYIDDQLKKTGNECQLKLKPGRYTYRVEAPMYHTEVANVEITDSKKEINVTLQPAFGYLNITSEPESGAKIMLDDKLLSQTTPLKTDAITSGEHILMVVKDMFEPVRQKITVQDGITTPVNVVMKPNFAELSIQAPSGATILINNDERGKGNWQGRLSAGVYTLEARLDKHHPAKQDVELQLGEKRTVEFNPSPIYGSVDVSTSPSGALVNLNGKEYGTTPITINKLLIGEHNLQITKQGYTTVNKKINISESQNTEINETLSNGKQISIISEPADVDLYIDNLKMGVTPYKVCLPYGNHTLKIVQGNNTEEQTVSIQEGMISSVCHLSFSPQDFTEMINGVSFRMKGVKGGKVKLLDANPNVNYSPVNDFFIGETEVSQELWNAVMNNNPSYFKGNSLPVEHVSWVECQQFIAKLNSLTGRTYRLPELKEWLFAARGGVKSNNFIYSGGNNAESIGWINSNSKYKTNPIASKEPNELGIYDMTGNVSEWCNTINEPNNSKQVKQIRPNIQSQQKKSMGGSWGSTESGCHIKNYFLADKNTITYKNSDTGLRLVATSSEIKKVKPVTGKSTISNKTNQVKGYDEVMDVVEQMPAFPGGNDSLFVYLSRNIKYPVVAQENGIQGTVYLHFVVSKNGQIDKIEVLRGVNPAIDKEAIRVVRNMPRWIPGKQNNEPVSVKYTLPMKFRLE